MTKADIVDEIAKATGLTKRDTKEVVEGVFESIKASIAQGHRIELRGFGVFQYKSRKPRKARNPKTGEEVQLEKRYVPIFKPSPDFAKRVDNEMQQKSNNGESID